MSIALTVTVTAPAQGQMIVPLGMPSPHLMPDSFAVEGARFRLIAEQTTGQWLALIDKGAAPVAITTDYVRDPGAYPQPMFEHRANRYTRAAEALTHDARQVARAAGGGLAGLHAIVDHTCRQFAYGHADVPFYQDAHEMPQLCGLTQGSCVDINAYLIASLRAAGYEAGYVTGYFIPEERGDHTTDMHCWVVTRHAGMTQEWDIAHHLKMGVRDIQPGLNPKPGVRVPLAHSMGLTLPGLGLEELKLVAQPMWVETCDFPPVDIRLQGYALLAAAG